MSATELKLVSSNKCFTGYQKVYQHNSDVLKCQMNFAVYLPSSHGTGKRLPVLIWLSGLTCSEQNFITKAAFQKHAEMYQIIVVSPDTSPRGLEIEGVRESWDFGEGAGFYVDATEPKWNQNFLMYSYINEELHNVVNKNFDTNPSSYSIFGHSMGGHGSLVSFLRNSNKYKSCSAFAPICNPVNCPWGLKAFTNYLGSNVDTWKAYDATELVSTFSGNSAPILIDQGLEDNFLKQNQLLPENFKTAVDTHKKNDIELVLNYREMITSSFMQNTLIEFNNELHQFQAQKHIFEHSFC